MFFNGDVSASHWPLRAAIQQGLRGGSSIWGVFDGSYPQTCSSVFTLLQHDRHRGRGVGDPRGVWGASEKVIERGVVDFNAGMGG